MRVHNRLAINSYETVRMTSTDNLSLTFLYRTLPGRVLLRFVIHPAVSALAGVVLNSRISRFLIPGFVRNNQIRLERYQQQEYRNFNDFFTRRLKTGYLRLPADPHQFFAPCDGKLSIYPISSGQSFKIKGTRYTLPQLLRSRRAARLFAGGTCLIFRLTPDDYHRYSYLDNGRELYHKTIPGVLHTVRPIAVEQYPVFHENTRQWTFQQTEHFGKVVQMEVGALFVGKIINRQKTGIMVRGAEKGMFEMGGSTIVVLLQKDAVQLDPVITENSRKNLETVVHYGDIIGVKGGVE